MKKKAHLGAQRRSGIRVHNRLLAHILFSASGRRHAHHVHRRLKGWLGLDLLFGLGRRRRRGRGKNRGFLLLLLLSGYNSRTVSVQVHCGSILALKPVGEPLDAIALRSGHDLFKVRRIFHLTTPNACTQHAKTLVQQSTVRRRVTLHKRPFSDRARDRTP